MQRVYDFLKKANTYYLGTIDNDYPNIRPFGTINIYNGKLYIQTGKKKDVYKQIIKNPNVFICASYQDKWIRIKAKAIEDDSLEANKDMLDHYPSLRSMYKEGDGNCTCFYLKEAIATIYSFTSSPEIIKF